MRRPPIPIRVQEFCESGRSSRACLWASVSNDAVSFHIDPSRSAEAAQKLFAEGLLDTVIVWTAIAPTSDSLAFARAR